MTLLYMHVCMYVRMYVCMYVCMYACMHVCMYVCMYPCMYVCRSVYILHARTHTYTHTWIHACMHTYIHTCTYKQTILYRGIHLRHIFVLIKYIKTAQISRVVGLAHTRATHARAMTTALPLREHDLVTTSSRCPF